MVWRLQSLILPCMIRSWIGEQFFMSSLQSCQVPCGSATPGARIFFIWMVSMTFIQKTVGQQTRVWKSGSLHVLDGLEFRKYWFLMIFWATKLTNLPWIISCIYKEDWSLNELNYILGKETLQKFAWEALVYSSELRKGSRISRSNEKNRRTRRFSSTVNLPSQVSFSKCMIQANS